jgi:hypothetical protein
MSREYGQDLVEYALTLPLLLLIIFGIIEFGILLFQYSTMVSAAREGARAGILPISDTCDEQCKTANVLAIVQDRLLGLDCNDEPPVEFSGGTVRVQVDCDAHLITSVIAQAVGGSGVIALQATATMNVE